MDRVWSDDSTPRSECGGEMAPFRDFGLLDVLYGARLSSVSVLIFTVLSSPARPATSMGAS